MRKLFTNPVHRGPNARKIFGKVLATLLAKSFQRTDSPQGKGSPAAAQREFSLYTRHGSRKYLDASERRRFRDAAALLPSRARLFCLMLMWSGSRISEALAVTPAAIDLVNGLVKIETLKKRRRGFIRAVPIPPTILRDLDQQFGLSANKNDESFYFRRLWPWSRTTGWRYVKIVMKTAGITGNAATAKGLRHAFGVAAFEKVPPHLVQRWLGHASLRTTAIYGDVSGPEEQQYAERLWRSW